MTRAPLGRLLLAPILLLTAAASSCGGGETALLVYNLSPDPKTIELDLADVGLVVPQTPEDWIGGGSAERITSTTWAIPVEGYGFRMLGVRK